MDGVAAARLGQWRGAGRPRRSVDRRASLCGSATRAISKARRPAARTPSGSVTPGWTAARATPTSGPGPADTRHRHPGPLCARRAPGARRHAAAVRSRGAWLIDAVHRDAAGIRVQAWLGDVLATEGPDGLRLDRPSPRRRRPLRPRDPGRGFRRRPLRPGTPALRRRRLPHPPRRPARPHPRPPRAALRRRPPDRPGARLALLLRRDHRHPKWWSQKFFGQVARRVDQIAVMSYDTCSRWRAPTAVTSPSRPRSPWRSPRGPPTC